jgi:hypothetical protein
MDVTLHVNTMSGHATRLSASSQPDPPACLKAALFDGLEMITRLIMFQGTLANTDCFCRTGLWAGKVWKSSERSQPRCDMHPLVTHEQNRTTSKTTSILYREARPF